MTIIIIIVTALLPGDSVIAVRRIIDGITMQLPIAVLK